MREFLLQNGPLLWALSTMAWSERPELPEKPNRGWRDSLPIGLVIGGMLVFVFFINLACGLHAAGDKPGFVYAMLLGILIMVGAFVLSAKVATPYSPGGSQW